MQCRMYILRFKSHLIRYQCLKGPVKRCYHNIPLIDFYQKTTGQIMCEHHIEKLKQQYPNMGGISNDRLELSLQLLSKFDISAFDACHDLHVLVMNPITMDNYGKILVECGFIKVLPKHIIRYHTLVKSRSVAYLKQEGIMKEDINLEEYIMNQIVEWPPNQKIYDNILDASTNIWGVRKRILEKYLKWKLSVTTDEFNKYCRNYLPLKHKPMSDIQESLNIAHNDIKLDSSLIRKNGFIIAADPINTKLILENVKSVAGLDIREAIKLDPAILKNNYNSLQQIRNLLEEYQISNELQRKCLRVYCMCPKTVQERLEELRHLKEYQVLKTHPRMLALVVHKRKMQDRLNKMYGAKKQSYSFNHLVSSTKVFNDYISSFGSKTCGRDLAILIYSSLHFDKEPLMKDGNQLSEAEQLKQILNRLKKHKYYLHSALNIVNENIMYLKRKFEDTVIFNNCQILLYPVMEIQKYIELLVQLKRNEIDFVNANIELDVTYSNLNFNALSDDAILSLVLYEIEKKYHFSGDGMWTKMDGVKGDSSSLSLSN